MALSAYTTWEVRTTGSDTANSGGFVTGSSGTDYSAQDSAQYSGSDLTVNSSTSTVVTSASHSFATADVGNILRVTGGTGFTAGFYQIVSVASGAATLDRSPAATSTTGGSYCVGGGFASPGQAAAARVQGNSVFIKSGTYTLTTSTTNVSNGPVSDTLGGVDNTNPGIWQGYNTTRSVFNADTTRPTISAGSISSINIFKLGAGGACPSNVANLILDGNSQTSVRGLYSTSGCLAVVRAVRAQNCTNSGFYVDGGNAGTGTFFEACEATGCSSQPAFYRSNQPCFYLGCESHGNSVTGFDGDGAASYVDCYSYANTGGSSRGFSARVVVTGFPAAFVNCTAYGNGGSGFYIGSGARALIMSGCVSTGNGAYGFESATTQVMSTLRNCFAYGNTSGSTSNYSGTTLINFTTLAGDPFVAASSGNFALNSTAGSGASVRAHGWPLSSPSGNTTGYPDGGAAQHLDSGGTPIFVGYQEY